MKKYASNLLSIILSIILVFFVWHKFLVSGNTVIFIIMFIAFYYFFKKVIEKENIRKFVISIIIAIAFAIIELVCTSINIDYTLNHILDKWMIVNFLGYTILAWGIISLVYNIFEDSKLECKSLKIKNIEILSDSRLSFLLNAILIIVAWLPYFLRYFPGLLTADSCSQVAQAIGNAELSNHHPIFHTGIISVFVNFGRTIFDNINIGVAFYTIFQMVIMSIMFATVLRYIAKKQAPLLVRIIVLLYYMFYPINALFGITMWKDVIFSGIIPIYAIHAIELLFNTEDFLESKKNIIKYIIISIFVMFLRNNGLYIVILTIPFIIIVLRKHWKKMIATSLIIILAYMVLKTSIFSIFNIKERFSWRNAFNTITTNSKSKKIS